MCSHLKTIFALTFLVLFAQANDGGGHGGGAPAGGKPAEIKSPEWMELNNSLVALRTKIKMKEEGIQKLIEEKRKTKDQTEAGKIVKQMISEHKEMQKAITDYEEKRNLLRYRFPEAGLTKEREYERLEGKSLEDIETSWNLNTKIKSSVKNAKAKYGVKGNEDEKKHSSSHGSSPIPKAEPNPLADPMVISK